MPNLFSSWPWARATSVARATPRAARPLARAIASCLALVTHVGASAASDPIYVEFFYEAPASCPREEYAFSLVQQRTQRVLRADGSGQRLHMRVTPERSGYRGVLTVRRAEHPPEKRSMTGERCDEVVEALAFTAALSIDPEATLTLGSPPQERDEGATQQPEPGAGKVPVDDREPAFADETPKDATVRFTAGPALAVERLMEHAVHVGGRLVLAASAPGARAVLPIEARLSLEALTEVSPAREPTVVTRLFAVRPVYCPLRTPGAAVLSLCAFARVGALSAEGRGWEDAGRTARFFATVGLEGWLRARMAPGVELWLSPAAGISLTRRRFAVEPGPEIIAASTAVSLGMSAGVGWAL